MLKTVVFLLDKRSEGDEKLRTKLEDEASYIIEKGYDAHIITSVGALEALIDEEEKKETLIVADGGILSTELVNNGYYVVGHSHEGNSGEQFPSVKYVFSDIDQVEMDSFVKTYQRYAGEPWEILRTKRLIVRETTVEDVDEFYKLYADPRMTLYMEGLFEDPEDEKRYQKDYIEKVYHLMGFGVWTLERIEDGAVIGRAGYSVRNGFENVELGFMVGTAYQRQGYCMEACRAILDFGRDILAFDKVQTLVKAENKASVNICEKLGFSLENEVDVEENIYGNGYNEGQKVGPGQTKYGKYLRMTLNF